MKDFFGQILVTIIPFILPCIMIMSFISNHSQSRGSGGGGESRKSEDGGKGKSHGGNRREGNTRGSSGGNRGSSNIGSRNNGGFNGSTSEVDVDLPELRGNILESANELGDSEKEDDGL